MKDNGEVQKEGGGEEKSERRALHRIMLVVTNFKDQMSNVLSSKSPIPLSGFLEYGTRSVTMADSQSLGSQNPRQP